MFGKKLSSTEDGEALNGITCEGCRTGKINDLPGFIVVFFFLFVFYLYSTSFSCGGMPFTVKFPNKKLAF